MKLKDLKKKFETFYFIAAASLFAVSGIYYFLLGSMPDGVVVSPEREIQGSINNLRAGLNPEKFWQSQLAAASNELIYVQNEPNRIRQSNQEFARLEAEIRRENREFYREFSDLRPTAADRQIEAAQNRIEEIENREFNRWLLSYSRIREDELKSIISHIRSQLN